MSEFNNDFMSTDGFDTSDIGEDKVPENSSSLWNIMNKPALEALGTLISDGIQICISLTQTASKAFNKVADNKYAKYCQPIVSLDDCIKWMQIQKEYYTQTNYFFIYIEKNMKPRNENDQLSVTIAILDENKKPINVNDVRNQMLYNENPNKGSVNSIVCIAIPAKTIDKKLINALNGNKSVIIKL